MLLIYFSSGPSVEVSLIGWRGLILPFVCILLAWVSGYLLFYGRVKSISKYLGNISYGMYLLHPIVFAIINKNFPELIGWGVMLLATVIIFITGMLAYAIERFFERPINEYGRRLLS